MQNLHSPVRLRSAPPLPLPLFQHGLWLGACAGLLTAIADAVGQGGYLPSALRADFGLRLLCGQSAAGACLGAALGLIWGAALPASLRTRPWRAALARSLPLWPLLLWVAVRSFDGARASRLPGRGPLQTGMVCALLAGAWMALYVGARLLETCRRRGGLAVGISAAAATACFVLSYLDQRTLPGLYEPQHAALSLACGAAAALSVAALAVAGTASPRRPGRRIATPLWLSLAAGLTAHVVTLDHSQVVRAALIAPRASHNHSLMWALSSLVARRDAYAVARRRAAAAAARRRAAPDPAGAPGRGATTRAAALPTWPDAHVLLVTVDALRADRLRSYGNTRGLTPALDALAAEGVRFERAYSPAPHSSYALGSLMASAHLHERLRAQQALPDATLAGTLRGAAYYTSAIYTDGIFHTGGEQLQPYRARHLDFERVRFSAASAEAQTDLMLQEIEATAARGEPSTLFWVHYFDAHAPYRPGPLGDRSVDRYDGEVARVDRAIGRLVREARPRLSRPLLVVVTADHGEAFREHGDVNHGTSLYDEQVRVPLLLSAPGLSARVVSTPVSLIDVAPTLLGMLGMPPPPGMHGQDLRDLATGATPAPRSVHAAVAHRKMVLQWPFKLIADLRFGVRELYDLRHDPGERHNLADDQPAIAEQLHTAVDDWLDALSRDTAGPAARWQHALRLGRLQDRRAVPALSALVNQVTAPTGLRSEAARVLGRLADPSARQALRRAQRTGPSSLRDETTIALGRLGDGRMRTRLRALVDMQRAPHNADLRARAALALAALGDHHAVPTLIEATRRGATEYTRGQAVRLLGHLGDRQALPALQRLALDAQLGHQAVIALGQLGDPRALPTLRHALQETRQTDLRDRAVLGLGLLGDPRALPLLWPLVSTEPQLRNTAEGLARLDAIGRGVVGGLDPTALNRDAHGMERCSRPEGVEAWSYLHGTSCRAARAVTQMRLRIPPAVALAPYGNVVLLTLRRADATGPTGVRLRIGARTLGAARVDGAWLDLRWSLPPGAFGPDEVAGETTSEVTAEVTASDPAARLAIDHILIVPRPAEANARRGG